MKRHESDASLVVFCYDNLLSLNRSVYELGQMILNTTRCGVSFRGRESTSSGCSRTISGGSAETDTWQNSVGAQKTIKLSATAASPIDFAFAAMVFFIPLETDWQRCDF